MKSPVERDRFSVRVAVANTFLTAATFDSGFFYFSWRTFLVNSALLIGGSPDRLHPQQCRFVVGLVSPSFFQDFLRNSFDD